MRGYARGATTPDGLITLPFDSNALVAPAQHARAAALGPTP
jgi:hypothetical protein